MNTQVRLSRPWLCVRMLMLLPLARETLGWIIQLPGCEVPKTRPIFSQQAAGVSPLRPSEHRGASPLPATSRCRATRRRSTMALFASPSGGADAGDAASEQSQRESAEGDNDTPILYIKGLKQGGGVGVWDDDGRGEDNAAAVAEGLRTAEIGDGDGDGGEAEERSVWEKLQESLGLGTWSYVGLGLALFIILLNNVLGAGWLSRAFSPDFDRGGVVDVEREGRQIQVMPLDDASNLLSQ